MKYQRKERETVDAVQYSKERHIATGEIPTGVERAYFSDEEGVSHEVLPKIEGSEMPVEDGDWVVTDSRGARISMSPEIFKQTFEEVPNISV